MEGKAALERIVGKEKPDEGGMMSEMHGMMKEMMAKIDELVGRSGAKGGGVV